MKKKNNKILYFAIPLLLIIAGLAVFFSLQQSILYDDYIMEDDFSNPSSALNMINCELLNKQTFGTYWGNQDVYTYKKCSDEKWTANLYNSVCQAPYMGTTFDYPTTKVENGKLIISAYSNNKITFNKNLKNFDVKINARLIRSNTDNRPGTASMTLYMNEFPVIIDTLDVPYRDESISIIKDIEDNNKFSVENNGNLI